ncbi:hypothetical protein IF1G_07663 [Cordyceps javanica]|uniref:Uncharacterized protein n=1 Tax=Cordyceps javanica TaxID=43265 RepID=A0A545UWV4_9HYPO|nr:hypothetical protein IF1G_07663 [Cordyceps javanica]
MSAAHSTAHQSDFIAHLQAPLALDWMHAKIATHLPPGSSASQCEQEGGFGDRPRGSRDCPMRGRLCLVRHCNRVLST